MKTLSRKIGFEGLALSVWILSFPLKDYYIFSNFSIDNLLVPILAGYGIFAGIVRGDGIFRLRNVSAIFILLFGAMLDHRVIQGGIEINQALWSLFRDFSYFLLPVILIKNIPSYRLAFSSIMIVAGVGAVSALLVSLGILNLEYVRFEESRIGIAALPKATGIFTNFGDLAMLSSISIACLISYKRRELKLFCSTKLGKTIIIICLLCGVVGTQSRNVIISSGLAILFFYFMKYIASIPAKARTQLFLSLGLSFLLIGSLAIVFIGDITSALSNIGGGRASNTAEARLESYEKAERYISSSILTGMEYKSAADSSFAKNMHNLWIGLLLRGGFLNIFAMIFLIAYLYSGVFRILKYDKNNKEAIIIGTFLSSMMVSTMFFPGGSLIFWFLMGMCLPIKMKMYVWLREIKFNATKELGKAI